MNEPKKIAVVGGGPAGMMAAGTARSLGADVTLIEHVGKLGKKLAITGKGRCNVTNRCSVPEFMENVTKNPRFLYSALAALSPEDTIFFFENLGVSLKVERGNRVFPSDDRAFTIVDAMKGYCKDCDILFADVTKIEKDGNGFLLHTDRETLRFDAVILATGGKSYPLTGSDGSGYLLAMKLGHTVTELFPSLVPLESPSALCPEMQGLSLKNVGIRIRNEAGKTVYEDFGEMMFTHFGVTGPMILSASAKIRNEDLSKLCLLIDLKPALDEKTLDARLLSDFAKEQNKDLINALGDLLPAKMIAPVVKLSGIDPRRKVNAITKAERHALLSTLKNFPIPISSFRPIEEAIVTSGGIKVSEIDPKTMESKIVPGLYFAGEILDVDAYTGGFNLQIAFSTGYLAGQSAAY